MTHLQPLEGARLLAAMPGILAAVIEAEPEADLERIEDELVNGTMQAWRCINGAAGYIVTHTATIKGTATRAVWIGWVSGRALRGLRGMAGPVADELADKAREMGGERMRIEGRTAAWLRLLPGFTEVSPGILERVL